MINTFRLYNNLKQFIDDQAAEEIANTLSLMYDDLSNMVTRTDFNELKAIVADLAEAQKRTEARVEELAEAQKRTEARVEELAEAQKRTEARVGELAEAQKRTEARVGELAEAQKCTEARVEELAEAQQASAGRLTRIETIVEELVRAQQASEKRLSKVEIGLKGLQKQVGGLSDSIGGDIEDIAYIVLYEVLKREFGWQVGVLERTWVALGKDPEEVNIFGKAIDPARPNVSIWIVGEAKHNLTMKEVKKFVRQVERARKHLTGELFPVCFCYRARPEVQKLVLDTDIRLVFSYGKLV